MTVLSRFTATLKKVRNPAQSSLEQRNEDADLDFCSACGTPITVRKDDAYAWFHNATTCRLVNLAFAELGVSFDQPIRVIVYPHWGPLKGYYSTVDPFTIHVAEEAYSHFPECIIFHEAKHLVDCLTKGWSEEGTPDPFARSLCAKFGFACPPPHEHLGY